MTFVAWNSVAARHDLAGHAETAARAAAILGAFDADPVLSRLPRLAPDRAITREEVLSVHTPRLWLNLENMRDAGSVMLDPDTYMVPGSFEAAVTTARLAQQAVERAVKQAERGFVVARPPGHHATQDRSMGFCLVNNVALAARRALDLGVKRVLVFDHDVHHGNGTQDIFYDSAQVLYQSFHLAPHYPGSGATEEIGEGTGEGFTMNAPLSAGDGDAAVRSLLLNVFLPAAKRFQPNLILFSSGFDSLAGDPLGGLELTVPFFGEMVERFIQICPKVVCFLEGGYQLDKIPLTAVEELRVLSGSRVRLGTVAVPTPAEERLKRVLDEYWSVNA